MGLLLLIKLKKTSELAQAKATEQLKEAKAQAAEIIEQAKKRANQIVDEETQKGHDEREKLSLLVMLKLKLNATVPKKICASKFLQLAVAGAREILEREIDANAQSDIVEKLVAEL